MSDQAQEQPTIMPITASSGALPGLSVSAAEPTVAGDEIIIGGPEHTVLMSVVATPRRRRRLGFVAAGLAMTLVAGAAVAGVMVWNGWGGKQPEAALPASSLVFARVDLAPGLGQTLALKSLADKFPKTGDGDVVESTTRELISAIGLETLEYEADVKPWFGGRVGFAAWQRKPGDRSVCSLFAIASMDEQKATTALSKVRDRQGPAAFGFAFREGYAVTASCDDESASQAAADAAVAEAQTGSVADSSEYRGALDALGSGQLVVIWSDLTKLGRALADQFTAADRGAVAGVDPDSIVKSLKGDLILGLAPTDAGIELRYRHRGGAAAAQTTDALKKLDALPGGSVLGVSTDLREAGGSAASPLLLGLGLGVGALPLALSSVSVGESCIDADPNGTPACYGADPNDPCLKIDETSTPAVIEKCVEQVPGTEPNDPCPTFGDQSSPDEVDNCVSPDLSALSDGYEALTRSAFTAAFSGWEETVAARLVVTAASETDGAAIETMLGTATGSGFTIARSGKELTATTKGFEPGNGTLAQNARYQRALEGMPGNCVVAFFVDVEKLATRFDEKERARMRPIKALGGGFGYDGADSVGVVRVVIE